MKQLPCIKCTWIALEDYYNNDQHLNSLLAYCST